MTTCQPRVPALSRALWIACLACWSLLTMARSVADPGLYEMRVYDAPEGKLDALHELVLREDFSEGRSIAGLFVVREVLARR